MMRQISLLQPPISIHEPVYYFPFALVTLGGALRARGIAAKIVDFDFMVRKDQSLWSYREFIPYALTEIAKGPTDVIGISSICTDFPLTLMLTQEIRARFPKSKIILGGPQPSSVAEETLTRFPEIGVIVVGEGEVTLCELMESDFLPAQLHEISGIVYRDGDHIVRTAKRDLVKNMDDFPPPAFDLLPIPDYITFAKCNEIGFNGWVEVGRGCPFSCSFCSTSIMWERKFRVKTPARVLEEMRALHHQYGFTYFNFSHDNFTTSPKYLKLFCDYFVEHNREKFQWVTTSRVDCINELRLNHMVKAGCAGIFFGIESGSKRIQKTMGKRLNLEGFEPTLKLSADLNLRSTTAFILGFPDETVEDMDETILKVFRYKALGTDNVYISKLSALAGTRVYTDNFQSLTLEPYLSSHSPMPLVGNELVSLIRKYPSLFSSYYSVPTPHLQGINLPALIVFYLTLLDNLLAPTQKLFDWMKYKPSNLFSEWLRWRSLHYPDAPVEGVFICTHYNEFVRWLMLERQSMSAIPYPTPPPA